MLGIVEATTLQRHNVYCMVAALAWLSYDILLTFGDEIRFVWRRRWSLGKMLYLITRYYALANLVVFAIVNTNTADRGQEFCARYAWFYGLGQVLMPFFVDGLLVARLYALYGANKIVLSFLIFILFAQLGILFAAAYVIISALGPAPHSAGWPGCHLNFPEKSNIRLSAWTTVFVAQVFYFGFAFSKYLRSIGSMQHAGKDRNSLLRILRDTHDMSPLFTLFAKDSSWAFFALLATHCVNVICIFTGRGPLKQYGRSWIICVSAIAGSRLYLNMGKLVFGTPFEEMGDAPLEGHLPLTSKSSTALKLPVVFRDGAMSEMGSAEGAGRNTQNRWRSDSNVDSLGSSGVNSSDWIPRFITVGRRDDEELGREVEEREMSFSGAQQAPRMPSSAFRSATTTFSLDDRGEGPSNAIAGPSRFSARTMTLQNPQLQQIFCHSQTGVSASFCDHRSREGDGKGREVPGEDDRGAASGEIEKEDILRKGKGRPLSVTFSENDEGRPVAVSPAAPRASAVRPSVLTDKSRSLGVRRPRVFLRTSSDFYIGSRDFLA